MHKKLTISPRKATPCSSLLCLLLTSNCKKDLLISKTSEKPIFVIEAEQYFENNVFELKPNKKT